MIQMHYFLQVSCPLQGRVASIHRESEKAHSRQLKDSENMREAQGSTPRLQNLQERLQRPRRLRRAE